MKNYFKLIDLKNIFLKKINKLDLQFQQYGGANFDEELEKYKSYNNNLEIINNQIYLLLTIKYIEYLIEFIKSLDGIRDDNITEIRNNIFKIQSTNNKLDKIRNIIVTFIGYNSNISLYKQEHKNNINSDKYNILNSLNKNSQDENKTRQNNITSLENELQIYSQSNNQLFDIINNNEIKIKNLINNNIDKNEIILENIKTKFNFLLEIISYILQKILKIKQEHPSIFKNYKIFNYCNNYRYTKSTSVYQTIDEICKLCISINK